MTGILQSRCQFRNIVWFVRDLSDVFAFEGGGGHQYVHFCQFILLFSCQFCPKNGLKRVIYRQVSVQICKMFPFGPHHGGLT